MPFHLPENGFEISQISHRLKACENICSGFQAFRWAFPAPPGLACNISDPAIPRDNSHLAAASSAESPTCSNIVMSADQSRGRSGSYKLDSADTVSSTCFELCVKDEGCSNK